MMRVFHQLSRLGKPRIWTIEVLGKEIITTYGEGGGRMQRVVDVGHAKNVGRSNEVSAEEDAANEAQRMILAKVRQGYAEVGTESATEIDWYSTLPINLRFYKPENQLSAALEKKLAARQAWLTRKRDGEMMAFVKGPHGDVDVYSRRMLRSHHLEGGKHEWRDRFWYLVEELERRDDIPPRSILLGDVVSDPDDDGRWGVASFMKSLTDECAGMPPLFFYCWDIPFWDGLDLLTEIPVRDRFEIIWSTFGRQWCGGSFVVPVEVWELEQLRRIVLRGNGGEDAAADGRRAAEILEWEGWVVVDPDGVYGDRGYNFRGKTDRPGKFCGKLKPFYEDDFVAKFDPDNTLGEGPQGKWGNGNHRGLVGAVSLYQYKDDGDLAYICECGGGITDAFRAKYSDPAKYPIVVRVECTDRTYMKEGEKTNALTHPRLVLDNDEPRTDKGVKECVNPRL